MAKVLGMKNPKKIKPTTKKIITKTLQIMNGNPDLTRNIKMILGSLKTKTFFGENENQKTYETLVNSLEKIKESSPELYHTLTVPEEPVRFNIKNDKKGKKFVASVTAFLETLYQLKLYRLVGLYYQLLSLSTNVSENKKVLSVYLKSIAEDTDEREKFLNNQFKSPQDNILSSNPLNPLSIEVVSPQGKLLNFVFMFLYVILFIYLLYSLSESLEQKGALAGTGIKELIDGPLDVAIPTTTFEDVKGNHEIKEELQDIVHMLKFPEKYSNVRIPKGVLMVGPPGTGKTLLARALAGEAGVKFYSFSGSEFEEPFAGVGPKRVRKLFQQARLNAPCIIFIDEIDALGSRDKNKGKASDSINQFLVELDGFTGREGIIVIGATNVPQKLDKALIRPGRFDRTVTVNLPLRSERKEILDYYLTKYHLDDDVNTLTLAKETSGFSGAAIENMVNIAILQSINEGRSSVDMALLEKALWTNMMGPEKKSMVLSDKVKELTAYHESGHALVALFSKDAPEIRKVTLMPRGSTLGMVNYLDKEETEASLTKSELISRIQVAMGGRVSEEVVFGPSAVTGGAMNDFEKATNMAFEMVTKYGMSDLVGTICIHNPEDKQSQEVAPVYGDPLAIESETRRIIEKGYASAKEIIEGHIKELHSLAKALLEYETLDLPEIKLILKGGKLSEKEERSKIETEQIENRKKALTAKRLFWTKYNQLEREQAILKLSTRAREVEEARAKRAEESNRS